MAVEGEGGVVVVEQILTPNPFKPNLPIGRVVRSLANSTMRVLVAFKSDDERTRFLQSSQPKLTPHTVTDPADLAEVLREVARAGIAWDVEELELGVCAVSAPVFGPTEELKAVVTVVSPKERFGPRARRKKAEAVRTTANKISLHVRLSNPT